VTPQLWLSSVHWVNPRRRHSLELNPAPVPANTRP
jgi:hypothetical protein